MATRYTHYKGVSTTANGYAVGAKGSETEVISQAGAIGSAGAITANGGTTVVDSSGNLYQNGEALRLYTKKIAISYADGTTENDTGWDVPANAIVHDVLLKVTTAEVTGATKTINIGTTTATGDPNGYIAAASVAATGIVKGTLLNTGQTKGALLSVDEDGAGALVPEVDIASAGEDLTWTPSAVDWAEFVGEIYVIYSVLA